MPQRRAGALAHRQRQTIDHEDLARGEHLAQRLAHKREPIRQRMQPPVEARGAEGAREVVRGLHDDQGTLMMVLEVLRSDDGNGEDLGVGHVR